jgi:hypothetical protein
METAPTYLSLSVARRLSVSVARRLSVYGWLTILPSRASVSASAASTSSTSGSVVTGMIGVIEVVVMVAVVMVVKMMMKKKHKNMTYRLGQTSKLLPRPRPGIVCSSRSPPTGLVGRHAVRELCCVEGSWSTP